MGTSIKSYTKATEEKITNFLINNFDFVKNAKVEEGTFLSSTSGPFDPYDYREL